MVSGLVGRGPVGGGVASHIDRLWDSDVVVGGRGRGLTATELERVMPVLSFGEPVGEPLVDDEGEVLYTDAGRIDSVGKGCLRSGKGLWCSGLAEGLGSFLPEGMYKEGG